MHTYHAGTICLILALISEVIAAFHVFPEQRVNFTALGLVFWLLSLFIGAI